jgi:hypothetical protein
MPAFSGDAEANLLEGLQQRGFVEVSFVAEMDGVHP